jgi:hypothetical protein
MEKLGQAAKAMAAATARQARRLGLRVGGDPQAADEFMF